MNFKPFQPAPKQEIVRGYIDPAERLCGLIADNAVGFTGGFAAPDSLFEDCHLIARQHAHEYLVCIGMTQIGVDPEFGPVFSRDHRASVSEFFRVQEARERELTNEADDAQAA